MEKSFKVVTVFLFFVTSACLDSSLAAPNESAEPAQERPAEQVFQNIQALKGVPASQLQQVMALFTGSLGVKCSYCHTNQFDKDDKQTKQAARRMINMVLDLNRANFGGKDQITCYTCHRGQPKPERVLELGTNPFLAQPTAPKPDASMPTVDQILEHYLRALGGKELLEKFTTRISRGSRIGADGVLVPEEVYQKAPNKMLVITKYRDVTLSVRVNAQRAWSGDKDKESEVIGEQLVELAQEANFYKEISLKELYSSMNAAGKAMVGNKESYVVEASSRSGNPEKLYFDAQSGLLVRRYRESRTVLGPFPLQTDFEDYQTVDGLKVPMTIRWSMPGRVWGRRIAEVQHNVPIEEERFNPR